MEENRARVGIFDSGVGGLTVLSECLHVCEDTDFYYYGDNGNAPYGNKSYGEILSLTRSVVSRFALLGVDAVLLACNTATAVCAETLRREFPFPVVGMEPAVKPAGERCSEVLVLATTGTASSERLGGLLSRFPRCRFTVCGLPYAAGEIERRFTWQAAARLKGERICAEPLDLPLLFRGVTFGNGQYDGVVLGCTHYLYYRKEIADFFSAPTYDGNAGTAKRLRQLLAERSTDPMTVSGDHRRPCGNPNIRFLKIRNNRVFFLGEWGKINEFVFISNVCFNQK